MPRKPLSVCVGLFRITQLRRRPPAEFPSTLTKYVTNIRNSPTSRTRRTVSFVAALVDGLEAQAGRFARLPPLFHADWKRGLPNGEKFMYGPPCAFCQTCLWPAKACRSSSDQAPGAGNAAGRFAMGFARSFGTSVTQKSDISSSRMLE